MFSSKCRMKPEKDTLLDKVKKTYHTLLQEDSSTAKALGVKAVEATDGFCLPEGSALKSAKQSARFNDAQNKYLEEKFNLGQEMGHKQDPEKVLKDMHLARKADGSRLFSGDEFLSARQIQSFFTNGG